jgi:DNA repair exonuclease SbcCD ATPase subunit
MRNNWAQRLAAAFKYPIEDYVFVEQSEGESSCACGHPIKNIFTVAAAGHAVQLGSECIENYAQLEGIQAQVKAAEERRKAEEKAHQEHLQTKELESLINEYNELLKPFKEQVAKKQRIDYMVWMYCAGKKGYRISKLKTLKGKIKAVQAAITQLKLAIKLAQGDAA